MQYLVYVITREDGKRYVGTTNTNRLKKRMYEHSRSARFRKFPWEYKIVFQTQTIDKCLAEEERLITALDTYHNGLNESENGRGKNHCTSFTTLGYKFSEVSRQKMSNTRLLLFKEGHIKPYRHTFTEKQRKQASDSRIGKQHSTKLTEKQVIEILELFDSKPPLEQAGKKQGNGRITSYEWAFSVEYGSQYKVTPACMLKIIKGKTWGPNVKRKS